MKYLIWKSYISFLNVHKKCTPNDNYFKKIDIYLIFITLKRNFYENKNGHAETILPIIIDFNFFHRI